MRLVWERHEFKREALASSKKHDRSADFFPVKVSQFHL